MKQIWYELKSQPVISAVTVIGTALAMFLIMVVVMLHQVTVIDLAPETKRSRTLYMGRGILEGFGSNENVIQSNLSTAIAAELTESLEEAERRASTARMCREHWPTPRGIPPSLPTPSAWMTVSSASSTWNS